MEQEGVVLWIDFPLAKVKCQQLLLESKLFLEKYENCVLNIVGGLKYQFSREEWKKFPSLGEKKIIRLTMLRRFFTLTDSQQLLLNEPIIQDSLEMEVEVSVPNVMPGGMNIQPVSLASDTPDSVNDVIHLGTYISILFDWYLLKEVLGQSYLNTVSEKLWKYVLHRSLCIDYSRMSFLFIALLIGVEPVSEGKSQPFLIKLWLETELMHFRKAVTDPNLVEYRETFLSKILPLHLERIKEYPSLTGQWQHASWHDFSIGNAFWIQNGQRYLISIYWMVRTGPMDHVPDGERNGCIWISEASFHEKFLPALYESYLRDLIEMLRYQTLVKPSDYSAYYGTFQWKSMKWIFLEGPLCKFHELGPLEMYEFNIHHAQNYSSPVMRLFASVPDLEDLLMVKKKSGQNKTHWFEKSGLPSDLMDIEDLFANPKKLLPPCLRKLVEKSQKDWCKYKDRLTLVKYLVDMGYGDQQEEIVNLMSLNRNNTVDRSALETLVKSHVKKKESLKGGSVSVYCGTIINSVNSKEEIIRCKYEKKLNGDKRVYCSDEEKRIFTTECACSVGLASMNHPLDYIQQKALKF